MAHKMRHIIKETIHFTSNINESRIKVEILYVFFLSSTIFILISHY